MSQVFPRVICLTLPQQRERQTAVVREFDKVGLRDFEFYPGFSATSDAVRQAYAHNRVKRYPDCFRCAKRDCGNPDCNNVLIPSQVAVVLGFQAMLRSVASSAEPYAAICEDDIAFAVYAKDVLASEGFQDLLRSSGLLSDEPTLIRLGRPRIDDAFIAVDTARRAALRLTDEVVMSNSFFLANRAFARLAEQRLHQIDHTADVIIHHAMTMQARCYTLNLQLVGDHSNLGDVPSLIHPKPHHLTYLRATQGNASPKLIEEAERVRNHLKKAVSRPFGIAGSPRCGSHFVSAFLRRNLLDIGHEGLGKDGMCAWQLAVKAEDYPYVMERQAKSDFFLHFDRWLVYARNPVDAIPSLVVENRHAPLSYAFRREAIHKDCGVDLDEFTSPVERAARAYAHWYLLALQRRPEGVLRVESLLEDCRANIPGRPFETVEIPREESGAGKPYLGMVHPPQPLESGWMDRLSRETVDILRQVSERLGYEI